MKQRQNNQSTDKVPCAWRQRIRILISLLMLAVAKLAAGNDISVFDIIFNRFSYFSFNACD